MCVWINWNLCLPYIFFTFVFFFRSPRRRIEAGSQPEVTGGLAERHRQQVQQVNVESQPVSQAVMESKPVASTKEPFEKLYKVGILVYTSSSIFLPVVFESFAYRPALASHELDGRIANESRCFLILKTIRQGEQWLLRVFGQPTLIYATGFKLRKVIQFSTSYKNDAMVSSFELRKLTDSPSFPEVRMSAAYASYYIFLESILRSGLSF